MIEKYVRTILTLPKMSPIQLGLPQEVPMFFSKLLKLD